MRRIFALGALSLMALFTCETVSAQNPAAPRRLICSSVEEPPRIDGMADDPAWSRAQSLITRDKLAEIDITLKAVYTEDEIFLLFQYPDPTESRDHKTMIWEADQKRYVTGPAREDTAVVKWSMEPVPVDLTLSGNDPYKADVWYWKANRTDHAGFADDKFQLYSSRPTDGSKRVLSRSGRVFHLLRSGDEGEAAYKVNVFADYERDEMPLYTYRTPLGSRADIRAKGHWNDGRWTVEFQRKLSTGHSDDVQLQAGTAYAFGVSRFEIAGRKIDSNIGEPRFGAGEITEPLVLEIR